MPLGENPTTDYPLVCDKGSSLNGFKLSKKKNKAPLEIKEMLFMMRDDHFLN